MVGNGLGFFVRRRDGGVGVRLIGDHDRSDLGRIDRNSCAAETVIDLGQRDRATIRTLAREVDIVQAFKVQVVRQVQLDDHLVGKHGQVGRVAHGGGRHDVTLFGDAQRLNDGDIGTLDLMVAHLLHGVRQVLVDEHDLTCVDRLAQYRVGLERHAAGQQAGRSHLAIEIVTQAGTGHQADLQLLVLGTVDQRKGYGLGFARAGEAAHANGHAVANKGSSLLGAHDLVLQRGQADDAIRIHLSLEPTDNQEGRSLLRLKTLEPSTKVVEKNVAYGRMYDSSEAPQKLRI